MLHTLPSKSQWHLPLLVTLHAAWLLVPRPQFEAHSSPQTWHNQVAASWVAFVDWLPLYLVRQSNRKISYFRKSLLRRRIAASSRCHLALATPTRCPGSCRPSHILWALNYTLKWSCSSSWAPGQTAWERVREPQWAPRSPNLAAPAKRFNCLVCCHFI